MNKNVFYGADEHQTISYLEFGEINLQDQQKKIWDFRLHQKAYDWLMLGRYANDFLAYTEMEQQLGSASIDAVFDVYNKEIHHPHDAASNFDKLIGLGIVQQRQQHVSFFELGQTILGCIEGMLFFQRLLNFLKIPYQTVEMQAVDWRGSDISKLFNLLAAKLHQGFQVHTSLPPVSQKTHGDIFFAKGITLLYAIKNIDQLFEFIDGSQIALFDYSLALGSEEITTIGTGKRTTFLNFDEFRRKYEQKDKKLYVKSQNSKISTDTDRIFLDCLYAKDNTCLEYIGYYNKIKISLIEKLHNCNAADRFLDNIRQNEWITFENFLQEKF